MTTIWCCAWGGTRRRCYSLPEDEVPKRFEEFGYGMVVADGMGPAGEAGAEPLISTLVPSRSVSADGTSGSTIEIAEEMLDRASAFTGASIQRSCKRARTGHAGFRRR